MVRFWISIIECYFCFGRSGLSKDICVFCGKWFVWLFRGIEELRWVDE